MHHTIPLRPDVSIFDLNNDWWQDACNLLAWCYQRFLSDVNQPLLFAIWQSLQSEERRIRESPRTWILQALNLNGILKSAGQGNYAWANMVGEMLCESRRRVGLPGLAISWGGVAGVGYIEEVLHVSHDYCTCPFYCLLLGAA
jgi:hypothetical protein